MSAICITQHGQKVSLPRTACLPTTTFSSFSFSPPPPPPVGGASDNERPSHTVQHNEDTLCVRTVFGPHSYEHAPLRLSVCLSPSPLPSSPRLSPASLPLFLSCSNRRTPCLDLWPIRQRSPASLLNAWLSPVSRSVNKQVSLPCTQKPRVPYKLLLLLLLL